MTFEGKMPNWNEPTTEMTMTSTIRGELTRGLISSLLRYLYCVNLRGQDKITLCQSINFVRINGDIRLSPGEGNYGMVTLFFCNGSYTISKFQCLAKVREFKAFEQMVFFHHIPTFYLLLQCLKRLAFKRRHATFAGNTLFRS